MRLICLSTPSVATRPSEAMAGFDSDSDSESDSAGMDTGVWAGRLRVMHCHTYINGTPSREHTTRAPGGSDVSSRDEQMSAGTLPTPRHDLTDNHRPGHTPVSVPAPEILRTLKNLRPAKRLRSEIQRGVRVETRRADNAAHEHVCALTASNVPNEPPHAAS